MIFEERGAALPPPSLQESLPSPQDALIVGKDLLRGGGRGWGDPVLPVGARRLASEGCFSASNWIRRPTKRVEN